MIRLMVHVLLQIDVKIKNVFLNLVFEAHKWNKEIYPPPPKKKKKKKKLNKKMGRAVPLKWAEQSRIEKWAESSGPRSPGPKWFWAEESRNP